MKIINIFVISILIFSCSFDNKSGVWKTESDYNTQKTIDQLQTLTSFNKLFEKTIPLRSFLLKFLKKLTILNGKIFFIIQIIILIILV